MTAAAMDHLLLPASPDEISKIQSERKRIAFERAKSATLFEGKLDHISPDKLDDPEEWQKIPVLDKEMLRALDDEVFYQDFCLASKNDIAEYWRSGGSTGRPLFYPRTFEDVRYAIMGFARSFPCMDCGPGDSVHVSFPLGIHPAGHLWARAAQMQGIAVNWVGAGAAAPSHMQLQLIDMLKPTLWMGMGSYGLHLANLAETEGINLRASSVKKVITAAEPLSRAKREKLERAWGAEVFDCFGATECNLMGAEDATHAGFRMLTDMVFLEVLDENTMATVAEGEEGLLIMTPLCTNHATPFLRWNTGDIVSMWRDDTGGGPFSVFPYVKHAHKTSGFFKVRGVNINHSELEDFMFADRNVRDFKAEIVTERDLDRLRLSVEVAVDADAEATGRELTQSVKRTFEVTPDVILLPAGTLAAEFEKTIKPLRFIDNRD